MSISSLNIGLAGMRSYQSAIDSNANNIANASTKNYQPQTASFQENPNAGVIVNISKISQQLASQDTGLNSDRNESSATDLATELTNNLQYKAGFELSAKIVKTADEMFSTLLDLKK